MLDDFSLADMRAAVALRNAIAGKRKELEASGGVSLIALRDDRRDRRRLRFGRRLTKHVRAIDFSMRFV